MCFLGLQKIFKIIIGEDNLGTISLSQDKIVSVRSKHIDIRYQLIMDHLKIGPIKIIHVPSELMVTDVFTKALPRSNFYFFVEKMGMHS